MQEVMQTLNLFTAAAEAAALALLGKTDQVQVAVMVETV